ncbi:NADH-quinone oxidoreductase subunit L [Geobacter sp. SVR]|uniref:NADH-quinone oxidoreductase subunit L n=1 Tax=Geobacter sp. SVR TaxID=2495594 RepID=UPI00143EF4A7|nr:NADH-quinone oxidoreductase subunit L [Geobacter sp. SVR]BCS52320.1 NADH-quinone oxidoreductase subunit L [Geobacter sp. SVR]GCF85021.1 NADH-quinone oxidoreductase subunit L [Geobacter sp. SVR]
MKLYLALILLLPLAGGLFNALAGRRFPRQVGETVACGVIWGAFLCSVLAFLGFSGPVTLEYGSWLSVFDFQAPLSFYLDQLSLSLTLMITFVCGLIHLYSVGYMREESDVARYFALLNIFVFAMLVLILAGNLPLLYLGWEGVGFCSYALIGFWYTEEKNATAGRKAFIVTRIGDTAFGIAIVWMYQLSNSVSITHLNSLGPLIPAGIVTIWGLLLLIGAAGKSAQLPLSVWLPDAMAGPTPVSAQIHAATMVTAGVYLLTRMFPLIGGSETVQAAIALTGGLTAFYAATCACGQRDLKRILAYSTISQIGYMVLGVGAGALTAASFHLLTHAFFKALLFLGAGCVITALHHQQDIFRMGGLKERLPAVYWPFLAGALCLAGFPLSGGFFSKDAILGAVFEHGGALYGGLFLLGLLTALLTAFYTFRMVLVVFHGASTPLSHRSTGGNQLSHHSTDEAPVGERSRTGLPAVMTWTLVPLAILGLLGGLLNLPEYLPGHGLLERFLALQAGEHPAPVEHTTEIMLQLLAAAVSLTGLAIAWFRYTGSRRAGALAAEESDAPVTAFLKNGWYLDSLYRLLFISPFVWLARFLWKSIDEATIDGTLDGLARLTARLAQLPAGWSSGRVATALYGLGGGVAVVLVYLVWVLA